MYSSVPVFTDNDPMNDTLHILKFGGDDYAAYCGDLAGENSEHMEYKDKSPVYLCSFCLDELYAEVGKLTERVVRCVDRIVELER